MTEAILKDTKKIVPASVYLDGEYGLRDICLGVPVKIGKRGVEEIIELKLTVDQEHALKQSAEDVRRSILKI
jgi:malate dehydrogenase